jgi:hypothetical protein
VRRWHQEATIARGQWRVHQKFIHDGRPTGCICDAQVGRFRKQRGMGCGRARCQVCHFEKIHGIKTHKERLADLRFREQLARYD